jgi:uncharacterized membrane protein
MHKDVPLSPTAKRNVATIADVEQRLLQRRPLLERLGETIAHFFGSVSFIAAHTALIGMWILWNVNRRPGAVPFDPYPFSLLSLGIGVEFILLTTFVLMNQKHQSLRNEDWAHLQLQLSMLTEQEVTKNLQLLNAICHHLGMEPSKRDRQIAEFTKPTPVVAMVSAIESARAATGEINKAA